MKNSIKDIWNEQAVFQKNEVVKYRLDEIQGLNCYIGTVLFSKAKIFILELDEDIPTNFIKRFSGVEVQIIPNELNKKELIIILLENELSDIFTLFIEDLINVLLPLNNSRDAITNISNRINYWKNLFGKYSSNILSPEQQRGLFGELYFLKQLIQFSKMENTTIITSWKAPEGTNQDFYFNKNAIEVKTTISNNPSIKVSNEYQLDNTGLDNLFIAFYEVNEYLETKNSLLSIINDIRYLLQNNSDDIATFNSKLGTLGITLDSEEEYNKTGYTIRNESYFNVTNEFPKITTLIVNEAISKISYQITPSNCSQYIIDIQTIFKIIVNG